uniref:Uncharacterized protein n=1 Tax=Cryptomonas curvata TaxID=233186 RepID=A0A7S0LU50_9CRYP
MYLGLERNASSTVEFATFSMIFSLGRVLFCAMAISQHAVVVPASFLFLKSIRGLVYDASQRLPQPTVWLRAAALFNDLTRSSCLRVHWDFSASRFLSTK